MKKNILSIFAIAAAAVLTITGCGAKAGSFDSYVVEETKAAAAPAEYNMNYAVSEEAAYDMAYEGGTGYAELPSPETVSGQGAQIEVQDHSRKLIRTVYMSLEAKEIDAVISGISTRINELGGYIENSNINNPSNSSSSYRQRKSADIVARIPSDRLDEFVTAAENAANVTYKSENVEDVTLRYTDVESHMHSLEVERKRLEELIGQAEDVDAIIALETRLSEIRYEIESYGSQLRTYDNQVDYSTVTMTITEVLEYTPAPSRTLGERIASGFRESLSSLKEFGEDALVWLVAALPVLIILAIIVLIFILVIKKIAAGSKARRQKREAKEAAEAAARQQAIAEAQAQVQAQRMQSRRMSETNGPAKQ